MPESIPDEDNVSRHLFEPSMGTYDGDLVWRNVFMFKTNCDYRESLVWRKYAPSLTQVHELGCEKQYRDQAANRNNVYFGALSGNVGELRKIRSKNGAGFQIIHEPDEGIHHAEISYLFEGTLTKADKSELKILIQRAFSEKSEHICPKLE